MYPPNRNVPSRITPYSKFIALRKRIISITIILIICMVIIQKFGSFYKFDDYDIKAIEDSQIKFQNETVRSSVSSPPAPVVTIPANPSPSVSAPIVPVPIVAAPVTHAQVVPAPVRTRPVIPVLAPSLFPHVPPPPPPPTAPLAPNLWCDTNEEMMHGQWTKPENPVNGMNTTWIPNDCAIYDFTDQQLTSCLAEQQVAFYGDSLLLNVFGQLRSSTDGVHDDSWKYGPGGYRKSKIGENGTLSFWWAPSAYYQQPHSLRQSAVHQQDVVIVGVGVWDMGTYYKGIDHWYSTMANNLKKTRNAMKEDAKLLLFNLHKLWPDRCTKKDGPCFKCNEKTKESLFRAAIYKLIANIEGVELIDTLGMTNTTFTRTEPGAHDAVHHGAITTNGEMRVLANLLCHRSDGNVAKPAIVKKTYENIQETFDDQLKKHHDQTEDCLGDDWKPQHNRMS